MYVTAIKKIFKKLLNPEYLESWINEHRKKQMNMKRKRREANFIRKAFNGKVNLNVSYSSSVDI